MVQGRFILRSKGESSLSKKCKAKVDNDWLEAEYVGVFQYSDIIQPSIAVGGHAGGTIAFPVAVVSLNGKLLQVKIQDVRLSSGIIDVASAMK